MDIRRDMMQLWKETFHDKDEYIKLIFDHYYTSKNSYYIYRKDKEINSTFLTKEDLKNITDEAELISSMLTIPYKLKCDDEILEGKYLCGLATDPKFRQQGLMTDMINSVIKDAEDENLDFLFLIPANSHLREYYRKFGFEKAFPFSINMHKSHFEISDSSFTRIEYFRTFEQLIEKNGFSYSDRIDHIIEYILKKESTLPEGGILHNKEDLRCAIQETFISDGSIYLARQITTGEISGICFLYIMPNDIEIYYMISDSEIIKESLLLKIKEDFPEYTISFRESSNNSGDINDRGLENPTHNKYKGMIKILNKNRNRDKIMKYRGGELYLMLD